MNNLKKFILFCLICITILLSSATYVSNHTEETISKETIRIAGDINYPPYEYVDENGIYKGFNVDIMRAIAIDLGIDIEIIPMKWDEALLALQKGEIDAIQGMTRSGIRQEKFDFTEPIVTNSQAIFVHKDTSYILRLEDLSGTYVSLQSGDIGEEVIKNISNIKLVPKDNQNQALKALLSGDSEAFIGNRLTGLYLLQKDKKLDKVKIVGEPIYPTAYCSAVLKGNKDILSLLNKGIKDIKRNGTYDKVYIKWFGESFTDKSSLFKRLLAFSFLILFITSIIAVLQISWNRKLKLEVAARTKDLVSANDNLKYHQSKLEQSNRLRGNILENIIDGIITFNESGEVLVANPAAEGILEYEIKPGLTWEELRLNEKIGKEALLTCLNGLVCKKNLELDRKDKEKYYVTCSVIPIKGPDDSVEGVILMLHDFTREKKYHDALNYNDKIQTLGKLAAGIAHELRNPLTGIKAFIDLLPYKIDKPDFREKLMKIVPSEIQRLNSLVNVLLDYAKPRPPILNRKRLNDVLEDVLSLLSIQLKKKNIRVVINCNEIEVLADEQQLKQVFINIILNSIDAIEKDGEILINGRIVNNKSIIEIKDNGHGIPEESLNRIFDPFYSLKPSGYGIGLAICQQLINENKGEIGIESKVNQGTTVIINLPVCIREGETKYA